MPNWSHDADNLPSPHLVGSREEFLTVERYRPGDSDGIDVQGVVVVQHEHTTVLELADDTVLAFDVTELQAVFGRLWGERRAAA